MGSIGIASAQKCAFGTSRAGHRCCRQVTGPDSRQSEGKAVLSTLAEVLRDIFIVLGVMEFLTPAQLIMDVPRRGRAAGEETSLNA
jgi:hypothetical protein